MAVVVVQSLNHVQLFATPWTTALQAPLSPQLCPISCPLSQWCYLTISSSATPFSFAFSLSQYQGIMWPKYWSFSFNISPSNKHPGLISFKMDWLDLLAVQETLKSLLQHHSSKASFLWPSAFVIVPFSHPYMTTGKNHSFDWTDLCW